MDVATEHKKGTLKRRHTALKTQLIAQNFQNWGLLPVLTDSSPQTNCVGDQMSKMRSCHGWGDSGGASDKVWSYIYLFRTPRSVFHVDLLQNPKDCAYWFKRGTWMTGYRLSIGLFFWLYEKAPRDILELHNKGLCRCRCTSGWFYQRAKGIGIGSCMWACCCWCSIYQPYHGRLANES